MFSFAISVFKKGLTLTATLIFSDLTSFYASYSTFYVSYAFFISLLNGSIFLTALDPVFSIDLEVRWPPVPRDLRSMR